ncbi:MAG: hypothetical protein AB7P23_07950 [Amphiplicatus sp.]
MSALLDLIVAALLIATSAYCFVLNRRLLALKDGQASLERSIAAFDAATRRAEQNLARIEGVVSHVRALAARGNKR